MLSPSYYYGSYVGLGGLTVAHCLVIFPGLTQKVSVGMCSGHDYPYKSCLYTF